MNTIENKNTKDTLFKWKHYEASIILLCVRWYLKYSLSFRDLAEIMAERGLTLHHSTIYRWVKQFSPVLSSRVRKHLKPTNDSWRLDETYLKLRGKNIYLYRAVDSAGNTIDFWLSMTRDKKAAKKFLRKALGFPHNQMPRVITTDKYAATEMAILEEQYYGCLSCKVEHRKTKYLNNIIEQDHRHIKRITNAMLGFKNFNSACAIISGIESLHMLHKKQAGTSNSLEEKNLIDQLFGIA
jgi:IS6 family transposase